MSKLREARSAVPSSTQYAVKPSDYVIRAMTAGLQKGWNLFQNSLDKILPTLNTVGREYGENYLLTLPVC